MYPTQFVKIASGSVGDNVALDTGVIDTSDFDSLGYNIALVGGVSPGAIACSWNGYKDQSGLSTSYVVTRGSVMSTGASTSGGSWGPGCGTANNGGIGITQPVPASVRLLCGAQGVGISMTWVVYGRRNHRGPDVDTTQD